MTTANQNANPNRIPAEHRELIAHVQSAIDYRFTSPTLLIQAFTRLRKSVPYKRVLPASKNRPSARMVCFCLYLGQS